MIVDLDGAEDPNAAMAPGQDKGACLPYGAWRRFCTVDLATEYTDRKMMQLIPAVKFCVQRKREGAGTHDVTGGMRAGNYCRNSGGL